MKNNVYKLKGGYTGYSLQLYKPWPWVCFR
jgi:hypothetical protein